MFEIYENWVFKYIGFYLVEFGGVDVIVFMVGVGENDKEFC